MRPWIFSFGIVGLMACASTAQASSEWGLGVQAGLDLPDGVFDDERASFDVGGGLQSHLRVGLGDGVWLRSALSAHMARGQDRVEWQEDGQTWFSDEHRAFVGAFDMTFGPELGGELPQRLGWRAGADFGLSRVYTWHSFGQSAVVLLDPEQNNLYNSRNLDPYTGQWGAVAGLHSAGRYSLKSGVAIEVEAGYRVTFVKEAPLLKTPEELDAVRVAFGLNLLQIGVGMVFPL